jgi:hypothetical protein
MGDAAASALLPSTSATDLSTVQELLRIFQAASARGETVSLMLDASNGKTSFKFKSGKIAAAGIPEAARLPSLRPAAAAALAPWPPPPAGRRKAPRSRGSLLRDERRRLLKIATDVFDWSGRCPLYTVHRPAIPAIPAAALVSGQQQVVTPAPRAITRARARALARYDQMVLQCKALALKLPPVPPPAPRLQHPGRPALRLRTMGRVFVPRPELATYAQRKCRECDNICSRFNFDREGWEEVACDPDCICLRFPPACVAFDLCNQHLKILHDDPNYKTPYQRKFVQL